MVRTGRVYDEPQPEDGHRILVMRRWPRGVSKERVDEWRPELGTPPELIRAWKQVAIPWEEFEWRYREAMADQGAAIRALAERARTETITLLCGCADENRCHRRILKELVEEAMAASGPQ
ncbi:MAG: DUF488 family protein [Armatimonadetes bacterium]|nr:DUF488 family protein [Armatimonadota bacterium]